MDLRLEHSISILLFYNIFFLSLPNSFFPSSPSFLPPLQKMPYSRVAVGFAPLLISVPGPPTPNLETGEQIPFLSLPQSPAIDELWPFIALFPTSLSWVLRPMDVKHINDPLNGAPF